MERWGSTTRDPPNAASPVNGAVENQPKDDIDIPREVREHHRLHRLKGLQKGGYATRSSATAIS